MKVVALTTLALIAFAANSVLCRLALGGGAIDAASFTAIRLTSGIAVLLVLAGMRHNLRRAASRGSWPAAGMLFLYAACFSFAYITLDTATGALILFGAVQITMILLSLLAGSRLSALEWTGMVVACAGFVYLVLPGVSAPSLSGFVLMATAGAGWGVYTLKGRGSSDPLLDTTFNFARTLPLVILLVAVTFQGAGVTWRGAVLAMLSGGLASGVGYTIWYTALRGLTAVRAAVVQLSVPILAALGGVLIVSEPLTLRLALASLLILGGILLVIKGQHRPSSS